MASLDMMLFKKRITKALISLRVCAGLSAPLLFTLPEDRFSRVEAQLLLLVVVVRVPTRQGKVREICFFFKVREKSGNSVKWSGKLENFQKSGNFNSCLVNPSKIKQTNMR